MKIWRIITYKELNKRKEIEKNEKKRIKERNDTKIVILMNNSRHTYQTKRTTLKIVKQSRFYSSLYHDKILLKWTMIVGRWHFLQREMRGIGNRPIISGHSVAPFRPHSGYIKRKTSLGYLATPEEKKERRKSVFKIPGVNES